MHSWIQPRKVQLMYCQNFIKPNKKHVKHLYSLLDVELALQVDSENQ